MRIQWDFTSTLLVIFIRPKGMVYSSVIQFALGVSVKWIGTRLGWNMLGRGKPFFFHESSNGYKDETASHVFG